MPTVLRIEGFSSIFTAMSRTSRHTFISIAATPRKAVAARWQHRP
jgi:hypothetical protein